MPPIIYARTDITLILGRLYRDTHYLEDSSMTPFLAPSVPVKAPSISPYRYRPSLLRVDLQNWLKAKVLPDTQYLFITLTLKQGQFHENGFFEKLTSEAADRSVAFLLKNVERHIFKRAARDFGKQLQVFDFQEGGDKHSGVRLHRHLCVAVPNEYVTAGVLQLLFRRYWAKTYWAMRAGSEAATAIHIEEARSPYAVTEYISKNGIEAFCPFTSRL